MSLESITLSPFLDAASKLKGIRKTETVLPIARVKGLVNQLVVGDDLSLRTAATSPVNFDKELVSLLFEHTLIIDPNGQELSPSRFEFNSQISNIDKLSLLWALYKSTYNVLAKEREITCTNNECKYKFKDDIYLDEILHEDTFTIWDIRDTDGNFVPFHQYIFPIEEDFEDYKIRFDLRLPSIQDNNNMLGMLSIDKIQENLEKGNDVLTKYQQLALVSKSITLTDPSGTQKTTDSTGDILEFFKTTVPLGMSNDIMRKYSEHFDIYFPNFYKTINCPQCGTQIKYEVNLEVEFFRKAILNIE